MGIKLRAEETLPWYCIDCQENFDKFIQQVEHDCKYKGESDDT